MDFLIRDDDISFLTTPEKLEQVWGWFLNSDLGKINFAVIPFVDLFEFGGAKRQAVPIGENKELTAYLKEKIRAKKVEILLHGYSHASLDAGYEFENSDRQELSKRIKEGKAYLDDLFGININAFVPPHNALGRQGLAAVKENGLNILAAFRFYLFCMGLDYQKLLFLIKRKVFSLKYKKFLKGKYVYPFLTKFHSHLHLDCLSFIPGKFAEDDLVGFYEIVKKSKGAFCLATHYSEMDKDAQKTIQGFIFHIEKFPENRFVFASDIFKNI